MTYHVVPFAPKVREGAPEAAISAQLQAAIEAEVSKGYELVEIATIPTVVTPGCLAFLSQPRTVLSTQLIFRR
jgi:hypothetical protein